MFFVFSMVYVLKNDYSVLFYYAKFPFNFFYDVNVMYVLNSVFYFLAGAFIGYLVDVVVSRFTNKKIHKKIIAFDRETGKKKKVHVVFDRKRI